MGQVIVAGGDVKQLTGGGREFTVNPESSIKITIGGRVNEGKFAGNGTLVITQKTNVPGFSGADIIINNANKDLEYLQAMENAADPAPWVLTHADGTVYSGQLVPMGVLEADTQTGTCPLECRGPSFEQI